MEPSVPEPRDETQATDNRIAELERDNEALRLEAVEARHSLLVNRDHVIGTEAEIGRLNRDVLRMQAELVASRKKIRALQKRKNGLLDRTSELQGKLTAARSRVQSLQAELERQQAARVPLSRRVARRLRGGRR